MCLKRHEPFKCHYVPKDRIVMFMHRNAELWAKVRKSHDMYMDAIHEYCPKRTISRSELNRRRKDLITNKNPWIKTLNALLLLEFNYLDSTLSGGGLLSRMIRIDKGSKNCK